MRVNLVHSVVSYSSKKKILRESIWQNFSLARYGPLIALMAVLTGCAGEAEAPEATQQQDSSGSSESMGTASATDEVAVPEEIEIQEIGVTADLVGLGLEENGAMQTPEYDANQAGWYTEGPKPGENGPAVITGHVDNKDGPDVFAELSRLTEGDAVTVTDAAGDEYSWVVSHAEQHNKSDLPYQEIWKDADEPLLRLITCAGEYVNDEYEDNLIVYAEPLS